MIVNERIKRVREHRKLTSKELAQKAGISASEVSLIERQMRGPKTETLQRIAAALEVSSSYLLSEQHADLPIEMALAKESLQIFLRDTKVSREEKLYLIEVAELSSAPQTARGWRDLMANVSIYRSLGDRR